MLNELNQKFSGIGKAVNTGDDYTAYEKSHRGYGGVAILWTKSIDHLVNIISDGNSRIQCIEIKTANPLLCISTYLTTKVENDRFGEYSECIDQLYEIIQKFQSAQVSTGKLSRHISVSDHYPIRLKIIYILQRNQPN